LHGKGLARYKYNSIKLYKDYTKEENVLSFLGLKTWLEVVITVDTALSSSLVSFDFDGSGNAVSKVQ